ncbi:hypothetical protein [Metapseudomonas otitidis]|uniref:hypothetical protein n=1 Tax=Metapseudomonas otitidis TaxID=319939 RepID=UPI0013F5979F|nr:hypothetical protein [Pseudomonas otitidis]
MELHFEIKNGSRRGHRFSIKDLSSAPETEMPWVLEDEIIQFELLVPKKYHSAVLELYQHSITCSRAIDCEDDLNLVKFIWSPEAREHATTSKLFWNYFGIAELNVLLFNENLELIELVNFQALQVAATKSSADKVEKMFAYLASISSEALHSVFSATRHTVGFEDGLVSPNYAFERLEHAISALKDLLPHVLHNPLTRLVPEHKLIPLSGREELDDSSIGWLLENLSVLQSTDHSEDAHIYYDGDHFKASALLLPVLAEQTDIYENRVIHGFIDQLIRTAQTLGSRMDSEIAKRAKSANLPIGYVSFFEKATRFKAQLIGTQINKIDALISTLNQYKTLLERKVPVKISILERPIITPKAHGKHAYRDLFLEIIKWHEKGQVDWSAYENLFAIESIPMLFEAYSYFRVLEAANQFLEKSGNPSSKIKDRPLCTSFIDQSGHSIEILREPEFWAAGHKLQQVDGIINSEAYTINKESKKVRPRSQTGINSKRVPDIAIKITRPNNSIRLIILDAKYSYADKSFVDYLPDLTMKYVHGIHRLGQSEPLVASMSILHPDDQGIFRSFHYGPLSVFGESPASPTLQSCGIILGEDRSSDKLSSLVYRLLHIEGIKPLINHHSDTEIIQPNFSNQGLLPAA